MSARAASSQLRVILRVVVIASLIAGWCVAITAGSPGGSVASAAAGDPVLAIGGDIACQPGQAVTTTSCDQAKTGALLNSINPNYVLPLGDSQYESGSAAEISGSYNTTGWGTDKGISRPAAGNHEYRTTNATPYYNYFGSNAGDPAKGFYSWDVTGPNNSFKWHMIALNSECSVLGNGSIAAGCGAGSPQEAWLKSDLAANKGVCTIAYWHRPRFSSSTTTPSSTTYTAFWNDLYAAGADIVLNGHAHDYERFDPQTGSGAPDAAKGLREFVVGTGGRDFQTMGAGIPNSVVRNASAFGVLKMTLHASSYDWQFVPAAGYSLTDTGTGTCHNAPPADTTPPSAPTNVQASAGSANQVNLSWNASSDNVGVANYAIYRGTNGGTPTQIATTTSNATTYSDPAVAGSTTYTYQVQAIDGAGNKSVLSNVATVTTPATADTTPPTAPSGLGVENVSYNELDIGWMPSTDSGTGVSGYRVYRKGPGETTYTLVATTTGTGPGSTSYFDTAVKQNSTYSYYVTAFDGAGNVSSPSNTITETTPTGPTSQTYTFTASGDATIQQANPTATGGSTSPLIVDNSPVEDALLQFNVSTSGCDTLTGATLTLTDNSDGSVKGGDVYTTGPFTESSVSWSSAPTRGTLLNSIGAVASNAVVKVDVTNGAALNGLVNFRIGSTSSDGVHYFSREAGSGKPTLTIVCSSAQNPDNSPPTAPGNLQVTGNTAGEVDLGWTAASDNLAVTEYDIYRGGTKIGIVQAGTQGTQGGALTYQDTTVTPSTAYSYTVKAFDAAGNASPDSNSVSVTTPAGNPAPAAPTNLAATATGSTTVNLTWTASTSPSVTGYNIYRGPHGGTLTLLSSSGSSPFTDSTAAPGTTYDYAVTAVATGSPESAKSNVATITTQGGATPPAAPTNLTATPASSTSVNLSWTAVNDPSVTGYNIYRGPHGGTLAKIASSGTSPYTDTTAAPNTAYDYAVTAVAGSLESAQSNVATATTPAGATPPAAPTNLTATPASSTSVNLSWTAVNDPSVTGYNIYRGPHGGTLAKIASSGTSPYTDNTAAPNTAYDYAVTAVAGSLESAQSNVATATTPPAAGGGGGGITLRNTVTTQVATAGTSWMVNMPNFSAGDFVAVWLGNNVGSTAGTPKATGWTAQQVTNESSGLKGTFLTRTMASGDPAAITVTFSASTSGVAEAAAFTGVSAASPVDVKGGQAEASSTAVVLHSTPSVTTTGQDVLVAGFTTDKAATWTASGAEAGTEIADSATGSLSASLYYTAPLAAGGHVQSATATVASVKAVSAVLALRAG